MHTTTPALLTCPLCGDTEFRMEEVIYRTTYVQYVVGQSEPVPSTGEQPSDDSYDPTFFCVGCDVEIDGAMDLAEPELVA